jgi:hypothetical protein
MTVSIAMLCMLQPKTPDHHLPLPPTPQVKQQPSRETAAQCCT